MTSDTEQLEPQAAKTVSNTKHGEMERRETKKTTGGWIDREHRQEGKIEIR